MMLWLPALLPVVAGVFLFFGRGRTPRAHLLTVSSFVIGGSLAISIWAALEAPTSSLVWSDELSLRLAADPYAAAMSILVGVISLPVVVYAVDHERHRAPARLISVLLVFVGAMQLLVLADDLLTLLIGWELVGACSWALIAHEWRDESRPARAAHAYNVTRFGDLGLFLAAGAAFASVESLDYGALEQLDGWQAHAFAAGILLAALAKSAQLPFSPWLFSAMAGPTPASALLHSATMVAAGAYALIRLEPVLSEVAWFGPVTIAFGLATALGGGVIAAVHEHSKKLLAASTSAQYGLMFVAIGAGYPLAAFIHLVVHAVFKSQLFLSAGVAIEAAGSELLSEQRMGRSLPAMAGATAVGALGLAAVPPLGAAFSKEQILSAAVHENTYLGFVVLAAGLLSAVYAARFFFGTFGRRPSNADEMVHESPGPVERAAVFGLAGATLLLGLLWLPIVEERVTDWLPGDLAPGKRWELFASLLTVVVGAAVGWLLHFYPGLVLRLRKAGVDEDWFALPAATERYIVRPTLRLALSSATFDDQRLDRRMTLPASVARSASSRLATFDDATVDHGLMSAVAAVRSRANRLGQFDDAVVDAGIRLVAATSGWLAKALDRVGELLADGIPMGAARLSGLAAKRVRQSQTGMTHHYFLMIASGTAAITLLAIVWS